MLRCGIIEIKVNSLYTNFCSSIRGTNTDVIGIYYSLKGKLDVNFWNNYDGYRLTTKKDVCINNISTFSDIVEISIRPFLQVNSESFILFNELLFNFLTNDTLQPIEMLFDGNTLPGVSMIQEIETIANLRLGKKTTTYHSKKEKVKNNLFDFSEKQHELSIYLLKNYTACQPQEFSVKEVTELLTMISDINRSTCQDDIPHLDWHQLSKTAEKLSKQIGTVAFCPTSSKDKLVILGKSLKIDGKIIPLDNPDFTGLSKNELINLAEHVQLLIEQGNPCFLTLQQKIINTIAIYQF